MKKFYYLLTLVIILVGLVTLSACSSTTSTSTTPTNTTTIATTPIPPTSTTTTSTTTTTTTNPPTTTTTTTTLPTTTLTPPSVTINLTAQGMAFDKSTINVPAGAKVTMIFNNKDSIPHNFALYTNSSATKSIFVGQVITGPKFITYTFTAPTTPGTYFFRCDVHPTSMTGSFIVE